MNNIFQDLIYSYDDFGDFALRRKMNSPVISETFTYDNINTTFDRGFCMHEHYRDFGLINMNGRMYDPYTSMFLSPDNYIQVPDNSQSFNRYAYCLNNPLKYTDPDGEFWHIIATAGYVGGYMTTGSSEEAFNSALSGMWQGSVLGGVSGGIGAYAAAKNAKINPWTGVHNKSAVLGESMSERIMPVSKDLQAEYLSAPEMDNAYFGREISQNTTYTNKISMEFNAQWIESKMAQNYHLYDIGPVGNKVVSPYYNMEQCRTMYYPNIHKTHYSSISIYNIQIRIIIWK